jgi:hypothetical protein
MPLGIPGAIRIGEGAKAKGYTVEAPYMMLDDELPSLLERAGWPDHSPLRAGMTGVMAFNIRQYTSFAASTISPGAVTSTFRL